MPILAEHPGVPSGIADGPDAVRRKVRELHAMGADVVKVATSGGVLSPRDDPRHAHYRPVELEVLVEEATAAGMFVMAHAQGADGIKNAIRAGIRSIEHGIFLDDEGIDLMLRHGTWLVPTLVAPQGVLDAADAGVQFSPGVVDKARAVVEIHREAVRRAIDAGVRIAMGTDSGVCPHGQNLRELVLMAGLGMPPAAVLEATTRSAARLLGVDDELGHDRARQGRRHRARGRRPVRLRHAGRSDRWCVGGRRARRLTSAASRDAGRATDQPASPSASMRRRSAMSSLARAAAGRTSLRS